MNSSLHRPSRPPLVLDDDGVLTREELNAIAMAFGCVLIPIVSLIGSVGNILSIVVLVHHKMRTTINTCLAALAISDTLFLLHSFIFSAISMMMYRNPEAGENVRNMIFPIMGAYSSIVTGRITSWLTVMLSIERFIAVYSPIRAKIICASRYTCAAIMVIYVSTCLLLIPFVLKYHVLYSVENNVTSITLRLTALGRNKTFYDIYGFFVNILFRLLPLVLIIVLNSLIMHAIHRTWSWHRRLSEGSNSGRTSEQRKITRMLLAVTFVFVFCILPGALSSIVTHIWPRFSRFGDLRNLYQCMLYVTFFLETANSAINFLIYMALSKKFCMTYKEIFWCHKHHSVPKSTPGALQLLPRSKPLCEIKAVRKNNLTESHAPMGKRSNRRSSSSDGRQVKQEETPNSNQFSIITRKDRSSTNSQRYKPALTSSSSEDYG